MKSKGLWDQELTGMYGELFKEKLDNKGLSKRFLMHFSTAQMLRELTGKLLF